LIIKLNKKLNTYPKRYNQQ